jgi:hypothetical protein
MYETNRYNSISGSAKKVKKVFPDLELPDFEHNSKPSTRFTVAVET